MKKLSIILSILLPCMAYTQTTQVTMFEAEMAAKKALIYTEQSIPERQYMVADVIEKKHGEYTVLFEILFESGESVIISGHKAARPVLAIYNKSDGYSWLRNSESRETGFTLMLDNMYQVIEGLFASTNRQNERWDMLGNSSEMNNRNLYGPYLQTLWGQRLAPSCGCKNMYNKYMPFSDGDCSCENNNHEVVYVNYPSGCTVTALAQLMNYWKYPVLFNYEEQIDWCNMPDSIKCGVSTDEQNEAVARLYKILGEVLGTRYGSCYGYLNPASTVNELKRIFGYDNTIDVIERFGPIYYLNPNLWEEKIRNEIMEKRPVLYWAFNQNPLEGAHTFVCDGYNSATGLFHFNWGHRNEGWCSINYIEEDSSTHWVIDECAMIGIQPSTTQQYCSQTLYLESFYQQFYNEYSINDYPPVKVVPQTMTKLISAPSTSTSSWYTIPSGATATYQAQEEIVLRDGFTVELDADFTARIVPCPNCETRSDMEDQEPISEDNANDISSDYMMLNRPLLYPLADLYPNPTSGELTVAVEGEVQSIVIHNVMGQPMGGWRILTLTDSQISLDVTSLPSGPYVLSIRTADGKTKAAKLIKE